MTEENDKASEESQEEKEEEGLDIERHRQNVEVSEDKK